MEENVQLKISQSQHFKLKTPSETSENFILPDTFTKKVIVILNFHPECNPCFISLVFSLKTSQFQLAKTAQVSLFLRL